MAVHEVCSSAALVRDTVPTSPTVPGDGHLRCCLSCGASFRTDYVRCPLDGAPVSLSETDPLIGRTIGDHYVIEELIGVGAMARVYRAQHLRLRSKRYALKVMYGELTASVTMRMRFAHEGESASKLEHPNIVDVSDFGCTQAGLLYLVMDLVEGPTLAALVAEGPMPASRVIGFARQLCAGLAHAHARGVIHRDFKPDNILVSGPPGAEVLRIADFGLAISSSDEDNPRLTANGVSCTPAYAAPEQLLGHDLDHRADLYALGVTLYEMLAGGLPFEHGSQDAMLWKVTSDWPTVSTKAADVPSGLSRLIRRLLARDPAARPPSANAVLEELDQQSAISTITPALPGPQASSPRRAIWWRVGLGITIAAATSTLWPSYETEIRSLEFAPLVPPPPTEARVDSVTYSPTATVAPPRARDVEATAPPAAPVRRTSSPAPVKRLPPQPRVAAAPRPVARIATKVSAPPQATVKPQPPTDLAAVATRQPVMPTLPLPPPMEVPRVTAPPTLPPPPVVPPPPPPPPQAPAIVPMARVVGLKVNGSLPPSVVRRALDRVLPDLAECTKDVGARVVRATFKIEETRRATGIRIPGVATSCVAAKLADVRTDLAPDVGEVVVEVRLAFGGGK